jgi:hypothetical protein
LGVISEKRNNELNDLQRQHKKLFSDIDYLINNKLTLLRTNTMTIDDLNNEEARINTKLAEIDAKIKAYDESAQEILRYVITFSELVKNAVLYYEFALDSEKQELVSQIFSELVFSNGKLVKYKAKEGFEALLSKNLVSGSGGRIRTYDLLVTLAPKLLLGVDYIITISYKRFRYFGI